MTVHDLIDKLSAFDPNLPVTVTDGYSMRIYYLNNPVFCTFTEDDGTVSLDIGIGEMQNAERP